MAVTTELPIVGMRCASCVGSVEKAIGSVAGVDGASVNLATNRATVKGKARVTAIADAVRRAGYDVTTSTTRIDEAPAEIDDALRAIDGVVDVRREGKALVVRQIVADRTVTEVRAALRAAGASSTAPAIDPEQALREHEARLWRTRTIVGVPIAAYLMVVAMPHAAHALPAAASAPLVQLVLATIVQAFCGGPFLAGAIAALRRRSADMNTLVALGTLAAWASSAVAVIAPRAFAGTDAPLWFDTSAGILAIVCVGRWLEERAKGRAGEAIRALMALEPRTARVVRDGGDVDVAVDDLAVGDHVRVRPGERVPTDGTVVEGGGALDEALLTGESAPVDKKPGDEVVGGTLAKSGSFVFHTTRVGADTALASIVRLVRQAQGSRAPVQRLADRVSAVLVPIVLAIAVATFVAWVVAGDVVPVALSFAVAVLVTACPCAMGLATPTALLVGTGRGASRGILVRDGAALEQAASLTTVLFDKTGTLTEGRPAVTDVVPFEGDETMLLRAVASVEQGSEHPLARAVVDAARARGIALESPDRFEASVGGGVRGTVHGDDGSSRELVVGTAAHLEATGFDAALLRDAADGFAREGKTPLLVAVDDERGRRPLGVIAVRDEPRVSARDAVARLRAMGIAVGMVSGDRTETASAIARVVGIEHVAAPVRPEAKAAEVARRRAAGERVGFVGDGVNDAPALAAADVGFAVGAGSDVALEASGVTVLADDLGRVPDAILLSRATMRTIRGNLFWAFAYNLAAVPVAAGVLVPFGGPSLSPMAAAALMAVSSLFVVTNSLRLRTWKPPVPSGALGDDSGASS